MKTRKISLVLLVAFLSFILSISSISNVFATSWTKVLETGSWEHANNDYWKSEDYSGDADLQFNQTIIDLNQWEMNITHNGGSWENQWYHLAFHDMKFWIEGEINGTLHYFGMYERVNIGVVTGSTYFLDSYYHWICDGVIWYIGNWKSFNAPKYTWFYFWKNSSTRLGMKIVSGSPDPVEGIRIAWATLFVPVAADFWNCTLTQKIWKGGDGWVEGEKTDEIIGSGSAITEPWNPPNYPMPSDWISSLINGITEIFGIIWNMAILALPLLGAILTVWFVSAIPECAEQMSFSPLLEKRLMPMYQFIVGAMSLFLNVSETVGNLIYRLLIFIGVLAA